MKVQDNYKWMVCVRCITYNHAPYIVDAMNGFTMQQTDFPFVCTVVDDASTDGEQEVIKKYLQDNFDLKDKAVVRNKETDDYMLTYAQHKTNKNCFFAVLFLKYNHYSIKKSKMLYISEWHDNAKYIAFCEGDDYWTDRNKLQKQIEVMESNEHIKLSYTAFDTVNHFGDKIKRRGYESNMRYSSSGDVLPKLFFRNFIQTCSACIRTEVFVSEILSNCPSKYDYAYFFAAACKGDMFYIPDITCVYRKALNSVTITRNSTVNKGLWEDYKYFVKIFYCGKTKPISLWNRQVIRGNILARYISHKDEIVGLIRKDPFILCLSPYAICRYVDFKIRNFYFFIMDKYKPTQLSQVNIHSSSD